MAEAALQDIPRRFLDLIVNLEISIRSRPGPEAGRWKGSRRLLGLYLGPDRTAMAGPFTPAVGARIVLYQENIVSGCRDRGALSRQIKLTLRHELAHHFGFTDGELRQKWPAGA